MRAYEEQTLWYEPELGWSGLYDEYRLALQRRSAELALGWQARPWLRVEVGAALQSTDPAREVTNQDSGEKARGAL